MVRKLVRRTLLSLSLVTPLSALGLGLGEIHLHSALNERLNADIDLLSVEPGDVDSIQVALGSFEAFARFGIDRPSELMLLRFAVETGSDGRPRIKVTSARPIREPFLDFLLELTWSNGRLLREYTLLLDPPRLARDGAPAAVRQASSQVTAPAPSVSPARAATTPAAAPRMDGGGDRGVEYGPVRVDDTLWSIAKRMRPDTSVSVHQMMMALYSANPEAFLDDNINKLRKGAVLRLEDVDQARQLSRAEAEREVARHSRRWSELKQELGQEGGDRRQTGGEASSGAAVGSRDSSRLKLVAPEGSDAEVAAAGAGDTDNLGAVRKELMLALEETEIQKQQNEALEQRMEELEGQLAAMQRLLSLKNQDLAQLQRQLGGEVAGAASAPGAEPKEVPASPESASGATTPAESTPDKTAATVAAAGMPPTESPQSKPQPVAKPKPAPKAPEPAAPQPKVGFLDVLLANPLYLGGAALGLMITGLLALVVRRRRQGGEFHESILTGGSSSLFNAKDGEGSSSSLETSLISDLADGGMGGMPAQESEVDPITEADVYMAYGRHQQAEELLKDAIEQEPERHELLGKLMEVYHKTKNKQAFLAQAQAAHGVLDGSGPLWARIAAMGHELLPDEALFADAPQPVESEGATEDTTVAIDDVLDIGLDLDALAAEMEPSEEFGAAEQQDQEFDLGLDLGDLESEIATGSGREHDGSEPEVPDALDSGLSRDESESAETSAAPVDDSGIEDLDFGLDLGEDDSGQAMVEDDSGQAMVEDDQVPDLSAALGAEEELVEPEPEPQPVSPDDGGLEFSIDAFQAEEASTDESGAEDSMADENALDFDLGDFSLSEETEEGPAEVTHDEGHSMDFELGDFDLPESEVTAGADEPEAMAESGTLADAEATADTEAMPGLDMETLDFAPDDEAAADEAGTPESEGNAGDLDFGDFGLDLEDGDIGDGLDELGTKLDLATAYVEMGDADGAREMLEEVLKEGDDAQKAKAQQLLEQIAAQA